MRRAIRAPSYVEALGGYGGHIEYGLARALFMRSDRLGEDGQCRIGVGWVAWAGASEMCGLHGDLRRHRQQLISKQACILGA